MEVHYRHARAHVERLARALAERDHGLALAHCVEAIEDLRWVRRGLNERLKAERE